MGSAERFYAIWALAKKDPEYQRLWEENGVLEKKYFEIIEQLPEEQYNAVQDFLMNCEDMSQRMLDIACEVMRFQ